MGILRKVIALGIIIIFVMTGCSISERNIVTTSEMQALSTVKNSKNIQLNLYNPNSNYTGVQEGWFATLLKDKFDVSLNIISDIDESMLGTMDLDFIVGSYENLKDYQYNYLYNWNENNMVTEYGSELVENYAKALVVSEDQIYGIRGNVVASEQEHEEITYTWDLRFDLYVEIGLPQINNLDDLINAYQQIKQIYTCNDLEQETYALSIYPDWDSDLNYAVQTVVAAYYGYETMGFGFYNSEDGTWMNAMDSEGIYVQMIKFYNKLYQLDLLDPEGATQNYQIVTEKVTNGQIFAALSNFEGSSIFNKYSNVENGKAMYSVYPEDATPLAYGLTVLGEDQYIGIGDNTMYPELCMEIINYLYSLEGYLSMEYGPKGLTWDFDENGLAYLTELGEKCVKNVSTILESDKKAFKDYLGDSYVSGVPQIDFETLSINGTSMETGEKYDYTKWESSKEISEQPILNAWEEWSEQDTMQEYLETSNPRIAIASSYVESKIDVDLQSEWDAVGELICDATWKAIYAETDTECEAEIQNMIAQVYAMNEGTTYEKCIAWCQEEAQAKKIAEDALN